MNRTLSCIGLCVLFLSAYARSDSGDSLKAHAAVKDSMMGRIAGGSPVSSGRLDSLPHMRLHDRIEKRFYPHLFGTIGVSTYAPNFDGLQSVLRQKEADYLKQGTAIGNGKIAVTTSNVFWVSIGIDFDQMIRMTVDGGTNFEEDSRIYAGSIGLFYLPQIVHTHTLQGFLGTGLVAFHAFVRAHYYAQLKSTSNAMTGTLEGIEMTAEKIGGFIRGGMEWEMIKEFSLILDATYYVVRPAESSYSSGSINFSGFSAGMRILFHFSGGTTP